MVMGRRKSRVERDSPAEHGLGDVNVAGLLGQDSQIMTGIGVPGLGFKNLPVKGRSLGQVASLMEAHGVAQQFRDGRPVHTKTRFGFCLGKFAAIINNL
jgi:hypothetical protein